MVRVACGGEGLGAWGEASGRRGASPARAPSPLASKTALLGLGSAPRPGCSPCMFRTWTTFMENPHIGDWGVPFMYSTIGLLLTDC